VFTLTEDSGAPAQGYDWVGCWSAYVVQLVNDDGTPVDITTGTLTATYTDVAAGSAYSFGGGSVTLTKSMATQGIVTVLNPAAYPTAALVRLTITNTAGAVVRRYGPLVIEVQAP